MNQKSFMSKIKFRIVLLLIVSAIIMVMVGLSARFEFFMYFMTMIFGGYLMCMGIDGLRADEIKLLRGPIIKKSKYPIFFWFIIYFNIVLSVFLSSKSIASIIKFFFITNSFFKIKFFNKILNTSRLLFFINISYNIIYESKFI